MAERRMFAKTIIDSDAFLDMPLSTQALYFHLSMRADDEGFINNPKKIQRMIGASDDDLKVLEAKRFIIHFESGVIVIKHWKIHNYIRGDRLQQTQYQEERQMLDVKENGAYTLNLNEISATEKRQIAYKESELPYCFTYKIRRAFEGKKCPICGCTMNANIKTNMPTIQHNKPISKGGKHIIENISVICESCNTSIKDKETDSLNNADVISTWNAIQIAENQRIDWFYNPELLDNIDVGQMSDICQSNVSIGKVRLGKDRLVKDSIGEDRVEVREKINYQQIADMYNETCVSFPKLVKLSDTRKRAIRARLNNYTVDDFKRLFEMAEQSDFLKGKNKRNWSATFDWLINDANMTKVLEGNYANSYPNQRKTVSTAPIAKVEEENYETDEEWLERMKREAEEEENAKV